MRCVLQGMLVTLATLVVAACTAESGSDSQPADASPQVGAVADGDSTDSARNQNSTADAPTAANAQATTAASPETAPDAAPTTASQANSQTGAVPTDAASNNANRAGGIDLDRVFSFSRPDNVRGLYLNAWSAGSRRRLAALTELAQRTEINSFVVDIKDATGYVSHPTEVPLARQIGATGEIRIPNLKLLLSRLEEAGIYPIARIVIVKDPLIAAARPDLAVQDTAGGPWVDNKGIVWLNAFNREVWDYHVAIAREVAAMGFPEIQWDYVRFPDAPASALRRAHFPGAGGRPKFEAIRDFLAYSREALSDLNVQVTADVFGVTTSATGDVGIGQVWESFIDVVDVALPMVYPSHYWTGAFGYDKPNAHPYEIVREALEDALRRSALVPGAGTTRPWLQDFTLGPPRYGAPEVRAQIQASYDLGIEEWILWNPGSRYTEDALEPAEGFAEEPLVRIADQIVPLSQRFEHYDTATAVTAPETSEPDSAGTADKKSGS